MTSNQMARLATDASLPEAAVRASGFDLARLATIAEEKRLRQLLDALPAAVYMTDAEGHITFYNEAAVAFSGRRPELGNDRWCISWRLYRPDGTPLAHDDCPMARSLKEGCEIRGEEAILERPDGSRVHFTPYPTLLRDDAGRLVGAVNMLVDISERKAAEQALQCLNATLEQRVEQRTREATEAFSRLHASEERFRVLVEGVVDYAIYMLDPDGIVTNWNAGAQRIKGYAAGEIIGRHFSVFYTADDRANGVPLRALETARSSGKYEAEGWRVRKDGGMFWASVVLDAIHDTGGRLIGFVKVTRDLTEKRAAEERLRQAQKMEAVGQLTGGVAHDFNNLLTAIIGNLDMLAAALPAELRQRRYLEAALRAAERGSRLTEHLLVFSRRRELQPEIVCVNDLLREIAPLCQQTVGDGIEVTRDLRDDLWASNIDAAQFENAILNLAANARDAMNGSGRLTIATENVGTAADLDLDDGEYVIVSVGDSGCGMSAEVLAHVFEPFFTTKDVGKGTGLGLSQVYGFAKRSGGTVCIESKAEIGTVVRLYLPRAMGDGCARPAMECGLRQAPAGAAATLLVVEDDPDVRGMILATLSQLGYRTLVAETGPEALAMLHRDEAVDLLFSDIVMPAGMSGVELARAARRLRPGLRILLSSGYPRDEAGAAAGPPEFPFIAKPYWPAALARKLEEVLAGARSERRRR